MRDSMEIVAWFTTAIPVSSGPEGVAQLPGMVLEASIRDGKMKAVASQINFKKIPKSDLKSRPKEKK